MKTLRLSLAKVISTLDAFPSEDLLGVQSAVARGQSCKRRLHN
jgi:hypothetical protein